MRAAYFKSARLFRDWLARNHATATELTVGIYRKDSGKGGITYPEALDEALCFGWIDGVRHTLDEVSFSVRFTPRTPRSYWSLVNIRKAKVLIAEGRMREAGLAAFEKRDEKKAREYSFETRITELGAPYLAQFRRNRKAWIWWQAARPGYRRLASFYVMSAKRETTRARRLKVLMECSAEGRLLPGLAADRSRQERPDFALKGGRPESRS